MALKEKKTRPLVRCPTGWGKTTLMSNLTRLAVARQGVVWVAVHRKELADQASARIWNQGIPTEIAMGGKKFDVEASVIVWSVQTLTSQLRKWGGVIPGHLIPTVLFVDEAHHSDAKTWASVIRACGPKCVVVGLTATPWGPDGAPIKGYDVFIDGPSPRSLVGPGLPLVEPVIYIGPSPKFAGISVKKGDFDSNELREVMNGIHGDVVKTWQKFGQGRATLAFAVDVAHSIALVDNFLDAGIKAEHVDGMTPKYQREQIFGRLASGATTLVSNVGIATEGFDCPNVGCIVMARPTKSESLFLQMVGRGLRAAEGKQDCIVLDHGNSTLRFGHPFDDRPVTIEEGRAVRKSKEQDTDRKISGYGKMCVKCLRFNEAGVSPCVGCGADLYVGKKVEEKKHEELHKITEAELDHAPEVRRRERKAAWSRMESIRRMNGNNAWGASFIYKGKYGVMPHDDNIFDTEQERAAYWKDRPRKRA